jgi:RND family efflux transporter MFP subunit
MKTEKAKGYIQLVLVFAFIAISLLISAHVGRSRETIEENGGKATAFYVKTEKIEAKPYQLTFKSTGTVQARSIIQIIPQVSGRVEYVHPDFFTGGYFDEGEVLFRIEPDDFELEVRRAKAEVARAKTVLEKEKVEGKASIAEWEQQNGTVKAPDLVARKPQLEEAMANVQAAEASLESAKLKLARTEFRLPKDGRVVKSGVAVGQFIQAGVGYGEVFYHDSLEVSCPLNKKELEWLHFSENPEVEIEINHLGATRQYTGLLNRRAANVDQATRFGTVFFGFEEIPTELVPGVFAEVTVKGSTVSEIGLVPASAIQLDGKLWTVQPDNRLKSVDPEIIQRSGDWVAVGNIGARAVLVTSKLNGATEGALANVIGQQPHSSETLIAERVEP